MYLLCSFKNISHYTRRNDFSSKNNLIEALLHDTSIHFLYDLINFVIVSMMESSILFVPILRP